MQNYKHLTTEQRYQIAGLLKANFTHSWSTVKLDLYGLKFYYDKVLHRPWPAAGLIKPPSAQRLPDIVTVAQMQRIIDATKVLSYSVFFYTLYSLGLRLGEGLRLQVGDIDAVTFGYKGDNLL